MASVIPDSVAAAQVAMTGAIVAACISGTMLALNTWMTISTTRKVERQRLEHQDLREARELAQAVSRYKEPLARSAYDLQSRIYNFLRLGLVDAYLVNGSARERAYVIDNTAFLVAQNLCWTELVRRELQFIDLGENAKTRELLRLQDTLYSLWGTDSHPPLFRIFAGEQRAMGEALIIADPRGPVCMGYGQFLTTFPLGANPLIDGLRNDTTALSSGLAHATIRLVQVHHALIDLLQTLDPDYIRFPRDRRSKA